MACQVTGLVSLFFPLIAISGLSLPFLPHFHFSSSFLSSSGGTCSGHPLSQSKHTAPDSINSGQQLCTNFLLIDLHPLLSFSFHHSCALFPCHRLHPTSNIISPSFFLIPDFLPPLFIFTFTSSFSHFLFFVFLLLINLSNNICTFH